MTKRWTPSPEDYELAGLTDAETGNIGRPLETAPWPIPPRIELDDGGRVLRWYETAEGPRAEDEISALDLMEWGKPAGDMLRRFAALADRPPQDFCAFARRWGILFICGKHGLPISHNRVNTRGSSEYDDGPPCQPLNDGSGGFEPIAALRDFAQGAKAILSIAAWLRTTEPGPGKRYNIRLTEPGELDELYRRAGRPFESDYDVWIPQHIIDLPPEELAMSGANILRWIVSNTINLWLDWGDVRPYIRWNNHGVTTSFWVNGMFGAMAAQLASAITDSSSLALCSECARPYFRERRARAGQANYCARCQRGGAPQRRAASAYRARRRTET